MAEFSEKTSLTHFDRRTGLGLPMYNAEKNNAVLKMGRSGQGKMKAIVKSKPEPGLWMKSKPIPEPQDNEVIIKIEMTGVCGTDQHIYKWDPWSKKTVPLGITVGHEFVGWIVALGPRVQDRYPNLRLGQRVSGEGHLIGCTSRAARSGRYHLDPDTQGIGVQLDGAFAEYLKLPDFNVVPIPDTISNEVAAILDALGNAVHTACRWNLVGEDVLITGAGPIGIMAAAVAKHTGARHVVLTDIEPRRLALASRIVDCRPVNVGKENLNEVMSELKMNEGFGVGLEMSGSPQALSQIVDVVSTGGRIAVLGISNEPMCLDWSKVVFKSLQIAGIYGREMFETWHKMIAMLESGLDISGIITDILPATDFEEAFERIKFGSGKVVLDWSVAKDPKHWLAAGGQAHGIW